MTGETGIPTPRLLAAARMLANMSQKDLATEAGLSTSVIGRYEAGLSNMRAETFERIVVILRGRGIRFLGASATISMGLVVDKDIS